MARKKKEEVVVDEAENRPDEVVLPDEYPLTLPVSRKEVVVHPWSWGTYTKIATNIDEIFEVVDNSGLDLRKLGETIKLQDKIQEQLFSGEKVDYSSIEEYNELTKDANYIMIRLMPKIGDLIVPILTTSTGLEEEEILKLNPTDVYTLVVTIYYVNPTVLGNVYRPLDEVVDDEGQGKKKK